MGRGWTVGTVLQFLLFWVLLRLQSSAGTSVGFRPTLRTRALALGTPPPQSIPDRQYLPLFSSFMKIERF